MYRNLTKYIIALLVILGDCAYAAESRGDSNKRNSADNGSQLLAQLELTKNFDIDSPANDTLAEQGFNAPLAVSIYISITQTHINLQRRYYTTFAPRAPPAFSHI